MKINNIFVTGSIKIGKSSVIKNVLAELNQSKISGFKTVPIFENGIRKGFALESFDGQKKVFAHTDLRSTLKFDIYKYDASVFEDFGTMVLERALKNSELIVLDEIGMMEKQTKKFKEFVVKCLNSSQNVLGAFQKRAVWFSDILDKRQDTKIFLIDEDNRDRIHKEIISYFCSQNCKSF